MPELPEVEIIRQYLDEQLPGRTIACVDILLPRQRQLLQSVPSRRSRFRISAAMKSL